MTVQCVFYLQYVMESWLKPLSELKFVKYSDIYMVGLTPPSPPGCVLW